jgi:imidazole glycerol-phosphate synthase subunit HisF
MDPISVAKKMDGLGAGEIIINSIDNDGKMEGYDLELVRKVSKAVDIPVVALGGAGEFNDFTKAINEAGASAVAAGSLFIYSGRNKGILINYPDKEESKEIFK